MKYEVHRIGNEKTRLLSVDNVFSNPDDLVAYAASLAPFPDEKTNYYPGLRLKLSRDNPIHVGYVTALIDSIYPMLKSTFDCDEINIEEFSLSMVTRTPDQLQLIQSMPHIDSVNPNRIAILHYLSRNHQDGTAFFRHRATGIEKVTKDNVEAYSKAINDDIRRFGPPQGYIQGSTPMFEQIGQVEGLYNRVVAYPNSLLHSGRILPGFDFSADPAKGRLTANLFITMT